MMSKSAIDSIDDLDVLATAAVRNYVDPVVLFGSDVLSDNERIELIDALADLTDQVVVDGLSRRQWSMRQEPRIAAVERLRSLEPEETKELVQEVEVPVSDRFGAYLQQLLLDVDPGDLTAHDGVDQEALLRALRVAGFAEDDAELAVRRDIAKRDAQEMLEVVMPDRLIGRDRELEALVDYCDEPLPDGPTIASFVLTGPGGAGKSALVSTFVHEERAKPGRAPLIYLDFDRAMLADIGPGALTIELSKQLGYLDPDLDVAMRVFRDRIDALSEAPPVTKMAATAHSGHQSSMSELAKALSKWPARQGHLTLVFDTFEEVAVRGADSVRAALEWAGALRAPALLPNLHLVIAGREVMPDVGRRDATERHRIDDLFAARRRLVLSDLGPEAAVELLVARGTERLLAQRLQPIFGGNPLVLRLLANFVDENTDTPGEIEALIADGRQSQHSRAPVGEIGVRFVYERILNRIRNPRIRALAYPGIILRRVTPDVIAKVLAPVVYNPAKAMDAEEATSLFSELAEHVWLVRKVDDHTVVHRGDTRRLMVPGLDADPNVDAEALHRAAAEFWRVLAQQESPKGDAFVELNYHLGFLGEVPETLTVEEAQLLKRRLGADLRLWPDPRQRAIVKAIGGFDIDMTEEEVSSLQGELAEQARFGRLERRLWTGSDPDLGLETVYAEDHLGVTLGAGDRIEVDSFEFQLAFRDARFEFLTEPRRALWGVNDYYVNSLGDEASESARDIPWLIAMSLVITGGAPQQIFSEEALFILATESDDVRAGALAVAALAQDENAIARLEESLARVGRWPMRHGGLASLQAAASVSDLRWLDPGQAFHVNVEPIRLDVLQAVPVGEQYREACQQIVQRLRSAAGSLTYVELNDLRLELLAASPPIVDLDGVRAAATTLPVFYSPISLALSNLTFGEQVEAIRAVQGHRYWLRESSEEELFANEEPLSPSLIVGLCESADQVGLLTQFATAIANASNGDDAERVHRLASGIADVAALLAPLARSDRAPEVNFIDLVDARNEPGPSLGP